MNDFSPDEFLDQQLNDVPLPPGLLERLNEVTRPQNRVNSSLSSAVSPSVPSFSRGWTRAEIDQALRRVPLPANFLALCRELASHSPPLSFCEIDDLLRGVDLPDGFAGRLKWITFTQPIPPIRTQPHLRWSFWAAAAALMLLASLVYHSALLGTLAMVRPDIDSRARFDVIEARPFSLESQGAEETLHLPPERTAPIVVFPRDTFEELPKGEIALAPLETTIRRESSLEELNQTFSKFDPYRDMLWAGNLGAPYYDDDQLPELEMSALPRSRGGPPPLVRGYDREFLRKEGAQPIIDPSEDPLLALSTPPLTVRRDSFEAAGRLASRGRALPSKDVYVEDFLAAVDYGYSPPHSAALGLRTATGPSIFGRSRQGHSPWLVQVGAQARNFPTKEKIPPTHFTIALDTSASMNNGSRLPLAKHAIRRLLDDLRPEDRFSLIVFGEQSYALVEGARPEVKTEIQATLERIHGSGGTDLTGGLQKAISAAVSLDFTQPASRRGRLMVISDSRFASPETSERVREVLGVLPSQAKAARADLQLTMVDVSRGEPSPFLAELARTTGVKHRHFQNDYDLYYGLLESWRGQSVAAANDVRLTLKFNPKAVAGYRLFGHAPSWDAPLTSTDSLTAAQQPLHLRVGESATVLYEIWLKHSEDARVATAELTWKDPVTGKEQKTQQRISRLQFETSFAGAPLPLQLAAFVAETAQTLRGSPFSRSSRRSLKHVLMKMDEANPILQQREQFMELRRFVEKLDQISSRSR